MYFIFYFFFMAFLDPAKSSTFVFLRRFNLVMGVFHLVQAGIIFWLRSDAQQMLTTTFLAPRETAAGEFIANVVTSDFISVYLVPLVALFLLISATAHFLLAAPGIYEWYVQHIKSGINPARWYEYSISSSVMIVLIAILSGMYDAPSLVLLFFLNATMIWFGHVMEVHNQTTKKTNWLAFVYGSIAGIVPWGVIAWYFFSALNNFEGTGVQGVPTFVYFILGTLFVFFNTFAINMFLQYKKVGPWKNYLFGEFVYIVLSLVAKSALAWQVFGGTMR